MQITIDDARFLQATNKLRDKIIVAAAIQAANRTVGNMRSEATKFLRQDIPIKPRDRDRIFQTLQASKANQGQAQLVITPKPVPLIYLKPKTTTVQTPRGPRQAVSVMFKGRRTPIPSGFLAQLRSGHEGIFRRTGSKRLPIKEMFSWIGQDVFRNRDTLVEEIRGVGEERFQFHFFSRLKYQIERELGGDGVTS